MEENASWSCSVVYLCASAQDDIHELYPKNATPVSADKALDGDTYLRQVYENVEVLLDENQGGYDEGETRRKETIAARVAVLTET